MLLMKAKKYSFELTVKSIIINHIAITQYEAH